MEIKNFNSAIKQEIARTPYIKLDGITFYIITYYVAGVGIVTVHEG